MTATADPAEAPRKKGLFLPLLLGLLLAAAGGAGGFVLMRSGFGSADDSAHGEGGESLAAPPHTPAAYLPLDPLIVNMPRSTGRQFLRFTAALEVDPAYQGEVEGLRLRIVDVMNGYLRAVEPADFEDQMILTQLRAQLLRRIQVVAGQGRVRDLLVIEFVLN